jgi:hypothetical protein
VLRSLLLCAVRRGGVKIKKIKKIYEDVVNRGCRFVCHGFYTIVVAKKA